MPPASTSPSSWTARVRHVYEQVAGRYDAAMTLFTLLGYRHAHYRRRAVQALHLCPGATVVDLGCGTGLNLPLLAEAVGPSGHVVGVDLSAAMLQQARARVEHHGLRTVSLVEADAETYTVPPGTSAVLATFSLSMMPRPETVVARLAGQLPPDGRMSVLDFRVPDSWPALIRRAALAVTAPLGETGTMARRDLRVPLRRTLQPDTDCTYYFGAAYVTAGIPRR